ncbi:hypothetical protein ACGFSB_34645 [Streptomyces sp. NPDC048441]|uniref:hypothetical protein n=1 Tax=Streptomyces sp. NPDC048441 TaxID=3365552 RepID=UPI0037245CF0
MSINRRQLLVGAAATAAAATAGSLGVAAAPAQAAARGPFDPFDLALVDTKREIVEIHSTGDVQGGKFGAPKSSLGPGWSPLEFRRREIPGLGVVCMVCGSELDKDGGQQTRTSGRVTFRRWPDMNTEIASAEGLEIFPHCIEYLPTARAVVVVGTRDPEPPAGQRPRPTRQQGSYQLYTAPDGTPGSFRPIPGQLKYFRQAHGVLWDPVLNVLWMYGWNQLVAYRVEGSGTSTHLTEVPQLRLTTELFINGHDLQPDYAERTTLWASGSNYMIKIFKEADRSFIWWTDSVREVKSFSRHEEGRGIYTTARGTGNPYGNHRVYFKWPEEVIEHQDRSSRIYKARLLNYVLPGS